MEQQIFYLQNHMTDAQATAARLLAEAQAEAAGSKWADRVKKQAAALDALRAETHEELEARGTFRRNMIELVKRESINTAAPLQVATYTRGDLLRIRRPPPKKRKKDKALTLDGAVASTAAVPEKKKGKQK
jgi:hypothetical protein